MARLPVSPANDSSPTPANGQPKSQGGNKIVSGLRTPTAAKSSSMQGCSAAVHSRVSRSKVLTPEKKLSEDLESDDTDMSSIPAERKKTKSKKSAEEVTFPNLKTSNAPSKRGDSSLEESTKSAKKQKTQASAKKNVSSSRKSSQKGPAKVKVESTAEVGTTVFQFKKILAKGWQIPLGTSTPRWCYLVEWKENETTGIKAGETSWESVNTIWEDQEIMVQLFETRMLAESRKGPPTFDDVRAEVEVEEHVMEKINKKK